MGERKLSSFMELVGVIATTRHPLSSFPPQAETVLVRLGEISSSGDQVRLLRTVIPTMAAHCLAVSIIIHSISA